MEWIREREDKAAHVVRSHLTLPLPDKEGLLGADGTFDPWELFPSLYGSYSSEFDHCAIDVLRELRDRRKERHDLGAEMFREMLCTANLCDYGTSPRVCFPTEAFKALLPDLIGKWEAYGRLRWGDDWKD